MTVKQAEQQVDTTEAEWLRLNRRMLGVHLKWLIPPALTIVLYAIWTGGDMNEAALFRLAFFSALFALVTVLRTVQLLTTRFRVTSELFEMRSGLLLRQHRSIPRDRIRRVDLAASPVHRLFRLTVLRIGTGQQHGGAGGEITLSALGNRDALALREELLRRSAAAPGEQAADDAERPVAELDWSWIRYAPLTVWGALAMAAVAGAVVKVADWFGLSLNRLFEASSVFLSSLSGGEVVAVLVGTFVLIGGLSSLLVFAEQWWNYRLEREGLYTYRIRRGLLTTRQIAIDRRRIRGVEVTQPLLMRLAGAARVEVIATGLDVSDDDYTSLQVLTPAVPRAEADRIAAAIAEEESSPTKSARLRAHPRTALRRRLLRAVVAAAVPVAALAALGLTIAPGLLDAAWILALVLFPVAVLLGVDAYRALGHATAGGYLVTRYGALHRRTAALRRDGVIGWKFTQSPTQRLARLTTVSAITAAGKSGAYKVRDVGVSDGLRLADEAVPELLAQFLRRRRPR